MKKFCLMVILTLAAGAPAADFLDLPPGRWWKNSDVIRQLNLTPDQQKKLDDIMFAHMEKMIDLKAALDKEELKIKMLLDQSQIDEKHVLAVVDKVLAARDQMQRMRATMFVKVRILLTAEQWEKMKAAFKEKVRDRFQRRMQERRGPDQEAPPIIDTPPPGPEGL